METEKLENLKIKLERDLNRKAIEKLIEIIRNISEDVFQNRKRDEILQTIEYNLESLKNFYENIKMSILNLEE